MATARDHRVGVGHRQQLERQAPDAGDTRLGGDIGKSGSGEDLSGQRPLSGGVAVGVVDRGARGVGDLIPQRLQRRLEVSARPWLSR
jgi:hypothetical protein